MGQYGDVLKASYFDVLRTSVGDVLRTSVGDVPWGIIDDHMDTSIGRLLGHPQDVLFRHPEDIGRGRPQDIRKGRSLALHWGPYGDVHRTSFRDVDGEWAVVRLRFDDSHIIRVWTYLAYRTVYSWEIITLKRSNSTQKYHICMHGMSYHWFTLRAKKMYDYIKKCLTL